MCSRSDDPTQHDLPLTTCCARPTDECVCGLVGDPCGQCGEPSVFARPLRLQARESYLTDMRCEACGYRFTTDTRDGR